MGFPKAGHYDTWLIDRLQLLVEENHNVHLYPTWPNTADYADTSETFGTAPLQSPELDAKLNTQLYYILTMLLEGKAAEKVTCIFSEDLMNVFPVFRELHQFVSMPALYINAEK